MKMPEKLLFSPLKTITIALSGVALLMAGCGRGSPGSEASQKVELTYWTWVPNMDKVVELWNQKNPNIHVTVNKQDGGDATVTKLLTAIKAGSGAPDLVQAEFQKIPTLVAANALADISKAGANDAKSHFVDSVWSAVTLGGDAVYAIPQDTGPMMFYYREDIFQQYGLTVPKTWEEYAATAAKLHAADPTKYLGTFSANDPGWFAGLAQQAGASWWSVDGSAWGVAIDSAATQKVANFWGDLVQKGVIDNRPMYSPAWNAALNNGTQVGWISAVWGTGVLSGNAGTTAGKWKVAPLPQWDASKPVTGNWGGSTTAITSQSKHQEAATKFAVWLNTDPEAVKELIAQGGIYPAATEARQALATPGFFGNQPDFYAVAAEIARTVAPFTYGPNVNVAYSAYSDEFAKAAQSKTQGEFVRALAAMQQITVDDLKKSGFPVK
jgi:multiple sugar transport system substrate-binding protein